MTGCLARNTGYNMWCGLDKTHPYLKSGLWVLSDRARETPVWEKSSPAQRNATWRAVPWNPTSDQRCRLNHMSFNKSFIVLSQTLYLADSRGLRRLSDIAATSSGSVFIWQVQEPRQGEDIIRSALIILRASLLNCLQGQAKDLLRRLITTQPTDATITSAQILRSS